MASDSNWRKKADELLAASPRKTRCLSSVAGKVDDRFEAICAARQRGMAWKDIAVALENGEPIKVDAVESAFMRICKERGATPPGKAAPDRRHDDRIIRSSLPNSHSPEAHESSRRDKITLAGPITFAAPSEYGEAAGSAQSNLVDVEARWVDDGE